MPAPTQRISPFGNVGAAVRRAVARPVSRNETPVAQQTCGSSVALAVAEAALEAWSECEPRGYMLLVHRLPALLSVISARVPGGADSPEQARCLQEVFAIPSQAIQSATCRSDSLTGLFMQTLSVENDQVYFLHFWRAFSQAARCVRSASCSRSVSPSDRGNKAVATGEAGIPGNDEGLMSELETLRDRVLDLLGKQPTEPLAEIRPAPVESLTLDVLAKAPQRAISNMAVVEAICITAGASAVPDFWRAAAQLLAAQDEATELSMEELSVLVLSWLHDAVAWEHTASSELSPARSPSTGSLLSQGSRTPLGTDALSGDREAEETVSLNSGSVSRSVSEAAVSRTSAKLRAPMRSVSGLLARYTSDAATGLPVCLHIYDVSQEDSIRRLNKVLAHRFSPVKLGGVFHAGVEVNGLEWSFGMSASETVPGISCVEPKTDPHHQFRQTVSLRRTKRSAEDIAAIISDLIEDYPGDDYDLLRRNCCHFADDFCQRLGVGRIPRWVHRLARIGARVDSVMQATLNRGLVPFDDDDSP